MVTPPRFTRLGGYNSPLRGARQRLSSRRLSPRRLCFASQSADGGRTSVRWKGMGRVVGRKRTSVRWRMGSAGWEENGCEGDGKGRAARDGRKTDKCEMDRCGVFRGCDEKTAGPATGSGIAAEVGSAVWIVEPVASTAGEEVPLAQSEAWMVKACGFDGRGTEVFESEAGDLRDQGPTRPEDFGVKA